MKRTSLNATVVAVVALSGATAVGWLVDARADDRGHAPSTAAERTVTLAVDGMTCAACPITVRKAMERVPGVKSVSVDLAARTATVVFDPTATTPAEIAAASANAGYPASPGSRGGPG